MSNTFLVSNHETREVRVECDGCRRSKAIGLPMEAVRVFIEALEFDTEHRFCQERPVKRCQYVDPENGSCAHERNLTLACSLEACPLA